MANEEFLQKVALYKERNEFDDCAKEVARLAFRMNIEAKSLLELSLENRIIREFRLAIILALAAATNDLDRQYKACAYCNAAQAARMLKKDENVEQAIGYYNLADNIISKDENPSYWATVQNHLGIAYCSLNTGDPYGNIEKAIEHFNNASTIHTREAYQEQWATLENNLGIAYWKLQGKNADNLDKAIRHFEEALKIRENLSKSGWAETKKYLGNAYGDLIKGNPSENIEKALDHYKGALEVFTKNDFPSCWATIQSNIGATYCNRIEGSKAKNIKKAIDISDEASHIHTQEEFPEQWANLMLNIGVHYNNLTEGDRRENVEKAIEHYNKALIVYKEKEFRDMWALLQNNLGWAYFGRIKGDRKENIEKAIEHFNNAVTVYKKEAFQDMWALVQNNIAYAYCDRIEGDRRVNIKKAIEYSNNAMEIYTRDKFDEKRAWVQNTIGYAYTKCFGINWADNIEKAIKYYNNALIVYNKENFPEQWAMTQNNLGNAYISRINGKSDENIKQAIKHYNGALKIYKKLDSPFAMAATLSNLGLAYSSRIQANKNKIIAIKYYDESLTINPWNALAQYNYASLLIKLNKEDEAERHLKKSEEMNPYCPDLHHGLGILFSKQGRKMEAEDRFLKAIKFDRDNASYHISFANLLGEKAKFNDSKKEIRIARSIEPRNGNAIFTYGKIIEAEGNLKEAKLAYEEALIDISTGSEIESDIHNGLGRIYSQDGKYKESEKEFKEALRLNPANKNAKENLSLIKKGKIVPDMSWNQRIIAILLSIPLIASYIFAWNKIISEPVFVAQSTLFVVLILAVLFIQHLNYFKVASVEFKMSEPNYTFPRLQPTDIWRDK